MLSWGNLEDKEKVINSLLLKYAWACGLVAMTLLSLSRDQEFESPRAHQ